MALTHTPPTELGVLAPDFELKGVDGRPWKRDACVGENGLLVMFICNHCPYVKAIRERLVSDCKALQRDGIGCVAVMSNDVDNYPEDSFDNMVVAAEQFGFPFPYLLDSDQQVGRAYGAVCTPDFFGYNKQLSLQYRGRLDAYALDPAPPDRERELVVAMHTVATTGLGPAEQTPSMGCSIKWR